MARNERTKLHPVSEVAITLDEIHLLIGLGWDARGLYPFCHSCHHHFQTALKRGALPVVCRHPVRVAASKVLHPHDASVAREGGS